MKVFLVESTRAMGGDVAFEEALNSRLKIMNPDIQTLNNYLESHTPQLSTGIKHIIDSLQARGTHVYLISGGFRQVFLFKILCCCTSTMDDNCR